MVVLGGVAQLKGQDVDGGRLDIPLIETSEVVTEKAAPRSIVAKMEEVRSKGRAEDEAKSADDSIVVPSEGAPSQEGVKEGPSLQSLFGPSGKASSEVGQVVPDAVEDDLRMDVPVFPEVMNQGSGAESVAWAGAASGAASASVVSRSGIGAGVARANRGMDPVSAQPFVGPVVIADSPDGGETYVTTWNDGY
ncbi:MAG: hypothetical protein KDL87_18890, partial [Verrucomicrobiae bacterium]|nr:hypothetical protein [Verrucomicrobiae bacterium]